MSFHFSLFHVGIFFGKRERERPEQSRAEQAHHTVTPREVDWQSFPTSSRYSMLHTIHLALSLSLCVNTFLSSSLFLSLSLSPSLLSSDERLFPSSSVRPSVRRRLLLLHSNRSTATFSCSGGSVARTLRCVAVLVLLLLVQRERPSASRGCRWRERRRRKRGAPPRAQREIERAPGGAGAEEGFASSSSSLHKSTNSSRYTCV